MKKNTFLDRILPVICALLIAGMAVYLTGCPDPGNDPGGEVPGTGPGGKDGPGVNTPGEGPLSSITFNLTGATAILASDGVQARSARAAGDAKNILFKALEDNSVQPLFDFSAIPNSNPPEVNYIARSPVAGKKDLYICFKQNWSYWTPGYQESEGYWDEKNDTWVDGVWVDGGQVNIGSFIHVKEDGKIYSIVWDEDNSRNYIYDNQKNDPVSFDKDGNLYFTVTNDSWGYGSSTSSSVIYKYNPETTKKTPLTLRANGMFFENVQLSTDGVYIIAKGNRWDSSNNNSIDFLRLIPTENPNSAVYIFYRASGGYNSSSIKSFALNPRTTNVYLSGWGMDPAGTGDFNGSGIYKIAVNGTRDITWTPIFTNDNSVSNPQFVTNTYEYVNSRYDVDDEGNQVYVAGYSKYTYKWVSEFCDKDGEPDYGKMMAALKDYFLSDNIEFRHPRYSEGVAYRLKDEDALEKLYVDEQLSLIGNDNQGTYHYPSDFCYKIGTSTVATRVDNYSTQDMKTLIVGSNNSVWGIPESWNGKQVLTQLINKDGGRDLYIPQSLGNRAIISVKPTESHVYFCGDVSTTGAHTGAQNIFRFSYEVPETVENLFDNIPNRRIDTMEVLSYTISGNYLYFSVSQGTDMLIGKINLSSKVYTETALGFRVTSMINY